MMRCDFYSAVSIKGTFILFPAITRLALLILGCAVVEQSKLLLVLIVDGLFYVGHTAITDLDFVLVEDLS